MSTQHTFEADDIAWNIYYRDREFAHLVGDPRLGTVFAASKSEAERRAIELGFSSQAGAGVWAVPADRRPS